MLSVSLCKETTHCMIHLFTYTSLHTLLYIHFFTYTSLHTPLYWFFFLFSLKGFNVETIEYNNVNFTTWDVGSRSKIVRINVLSIIIFTVILFPSLLSSSVHCGHITFKISMH